MDNRNNTQNMKNVPGAGRGSLLFEHPRKAASGMLYSGVVLGILLFSLFIGFTLAFVSNSTGATTEEIAASEWYKYVSYLAGQVVNLLAIAVFVAVFRERPSSFGWRKAHPKYFLVAILLAYGTLFALSYLNVWASELFALFGYEAESSELPSLAGAGFVGALFVIAVLPAVFEETVFRGVILEGVKDIGTVAACLLGGLLFSLFHMNPMQTVYQFVCGCIFTLVALRANSLLPAVLMHFLNNAVILFESKFGFLSGVPTAGAVAIYVTSALCLVAGLVFLIFFDRKNARKKEGPIRPFLLPALPGLLVAALVWILTFASGIGG